MKKWIGLAVAAVLVVAGGYYLLVPGGPVADQPTWEHLYGGAGRDDATHAVATPDGGTIIAGDRTVDVNAGRDAWVIRLDVDGNTVWERTWGGAEDEVVEAVQMLADGGVVVAGETIGSNSGIGQAWVARLDADGNTVWTHEYETTREGAPHAVAALADGGIVVAGTQQADNPNYFDGWVARLDGQGTVLWERFYGGADDETIQAVRELPDGSLVFAGKTGSLGAGDTDAWVVKLSAAGDVQWERAHGTAAADAALDLLLLEDGFMLAGWSEGESASEQRDGWVVRLDREGRKLWERIYGDREHDMVRSIHPAQGGGYILVGSTASSRGHGRLDAWVLRIDEQGEQLWERMLGGEEDDVATDVVPQADGAFVVTGTEESKGAGRSDAWVLRLNAVGRLGRTN